MSSRPPYSFQHWEVMRENLRKGHPKNLPPKLIIMRQKGAEQLWDLLGSRVEIELHVTDYYEELCLVVQ